MQDYPDDSNLCRGGAPPGRFFPNPHRNLLVHARKLCEMKDLFFGCFLVASQIFRKK
jgi:hypothetical protein